VRGEMRRRIPVLPTYSSAGLSRTNPAFRDLAGGWEIVNAGRGYGASDGASRRSAPMTLDQARRPGRRTCFCNVAQLFSIPVTRFLLN
jgi:hypothetical protein